ncbi:MAG: TVP38/TMEM64 family protein [Euryarchaeota archaeon]|nr:TVP38/TMEM64 family protein [Euryarchaeota archaeon]MBT4406275.1 TVP38/TMEM64 family protein [Euryarchaeota archaeon]MBT6644876.1 TVP38/TMEM64 family protein [Euryarchaeota archaeon]
MKDMPTLGDLPYLTHGESEIFSRHDELERIKEMHPRIIRVRALIGLLFIVIFIIAGIFLVSNTKVVLDWVRGFGDAGPLYVTIFLAVSVVLCMPTPLLKVGIGAIFGVWGGMLINFTGSIVGGVIAFGLGRWLFRDLISEMVASDPRYFNLDSALGRESMRISILVRLSPIIPDEWLNYILGAGPVSLRVFLISNMSNLIYSLIYAYYGHVLGILVLRSSGMSEVSHTNGALMMLFAGLIATIIATIFVTRAVMKALSSFVDEEE